MRGHMAVAPFDLDRFVEAQESVYQCVRAELRRGGKESHWMWFVFPQVKGLGASAMSQRFAIGSLDEARAFLDHAVLRSRLRECVELVNEIEGRSIDEIFGYPDTLKFHSSMTLFAHATADNGIFLEALSRYFGGEFDPVTMKRLTEGVGLTQRTGCATWFRRVSRPIPIFNLAPIDVGRMSSIPQPR
jgi:uncharacterized protein (DUF1810 family)